MKKHEKKRLQGIKVQQKIAKTKKHLKTELESCNMETSNIETFISAINKLSTGDLKVINTYADKFAMHEYEGFSDIVRLAQTILIERSLKLT